MWRATYLGRPAEITIGDSRIMISDGGGIRAPLSAFLYVYVSNADETFLRAIEAEAELIEPLSNTPYGDRRAMVQWKHLANCDEIDAFLNV
jgi:PhnB protein